MGQVDLDVTVFVKFVGYAALIVIVFIHYSRFLIPSDQTHIPIKTVIFSEKQNA